MRIAFAVALLVALVPPAEAHPAYDYVGGCGLAASSDGTNSAQTEWHGEIHAAVVATETSMGTPVALPVRVDCELRAGTAPRAGLAASGTGVAGGAVTFTFHADPDEVFTFCETVTVAGEQHQECAEVTTIPLVPEPLVPEPLEEFLREIEPHVPGEAFCDSVAAQSGGPLDQLPVFDIRSDGDVYVLGAWIWDCPPYGTSGT